MESLTSLAISSWVAFAGPAADPLEIVWRSPSGCPSVSEVRDRVVALAGPLEATLAIRVRAEVTREGTRPLWRLNLQVQVGGARLERSLRAGRCQSLVDALALFVAMSTTSRSATPPREPATQGHVSDDALVTKDATVTGDGPASEVPGTKVSSVQVAISDNDEALRMRAIGRRPALGRARRFDARVRTWHVFMGVDAGSAWGQFSAAALALEAVVGVQYHHWRFFAFSSNLIQLLHPIPDPEVRNLRAFSGGANLCYALETKRVAFPFCLGWSAGRQFANRTSPGDTRRLRTMLSTLHSAVSMYVWVTRTLAPYAVVRVDIPLLRARRFYAEYPISWSPAPVAVRVSAGFEFGGPRRRTRK